MRLLKTSCCAAALSLALAACGGTSGHNGSGDMQMKIGYTATGAAYSDLYVCEDKGIFKKNGLDVDLKLLNSSSQLLSALSSHSVQIGAGVAKSTAAGALKGIDLRYVALPVPSYYMEMWGDPAIKSLDDVKGKKIGLSSPGSLGDTAVDAMLEDKGWSESDVQKTYLKSSPAEVTALQKGAVDVIVTQPPRSASTGKLGFKKVMDFTRYPAAANAYTALGGYVDDNSDAVEAFVKSEVECLSILHTDKKTALASITKHSGNEDEKLVEYSYNFFEKLWARNPVVDPDLLLEAFAEAADEQGVDAPSNVDKYIDNSRLKDLESSGFIDDLYAGKS